MLCTENPDIICITETWLCSDVGDSSIVGDLPFTVFRADRADSAYGGACIISRNCAVKAVQVCVSEKFAKIEVAAIDILNVQNALRIIAIYRSPLPDTDIDAVSDIKRLIKCLKQLCNVNRSIIITGDLNLPNINWNCPNLISDRDCCSVLFANFASQYCFDQHVDSFTRPPTSARNLASGICAGTLLDLVLCNDTHIIHDVEVTEPFSVSDHCIVNFNLSFLPLKCDFSHSFPVDVNYHNFKMCDWDAINNYLFNVDWGDVYSYCENAEQHADAFYLVVNSCIDEFVPLSCNRNNSNVKGVHYPPHIRKLFLSRRSILGAYTNVSVQLFILHAIRLLVPNVAKLFLFHPTA